MTKGEAVWRIIPELREYIETNILPLYKAHDTAHGPEHVRVVLENSLALLDGLDVDPNMVYAVAAYHDVGLRVSREEHETVSGQWLWEDKSLERWFTPEQRQTMREAVEDHRASRQEPPRNIYGRIVSEADRDLDPERVVRRMMEYSKAHWPQWSAEEHIARIFDHV
ncbi:HD domain-containing protein, partial [Acutalibacter muris]